MYDIEKHRFSMCSLNSHVFTIDEDGPQESPQLAPVPTPAASQGISSKLEGKQGQQDLACDLHSSSTCCGTKPDLTAIYSKIKLDKVTEASLCIAGIQCPIGGDSKQGNT